MSCSDVQYRDGPAPAVIQLDIFQAARAGDCARLACLLEDGADVNAYDRWDSCPLYYACLAGHDKAARMLLEAGAGAVFADAVTADRCYRAAPNLSTRRLLREYEARPLPPPPPLARLAAAIRSAPPDITLHVQGRSIEAHRVILAARSPYFRRKLAKEWRNRRELTFSRSHGLSFELMRTLVSFFYSDRVDVKAEDVEAFARICKACKCQELLEAANRFTAQKHNMYRDERTRQLDRDYPQRRFVWRARSAQDGRLPSALRRILQDCLANSRQEDLGNNEPAEACRGSDYDDLADIFIKVGNRIFRCHQMILALRSEYFKTRLSRRNDFLERHYSVLEEHDVSAEAFEKMLEYVYTDELEDLVGDDPVSQAEDLLDVASRYLLFRLKPVVADLLLPHLDLDHVSPAQLCYWLTLSDMYDVAKIREHCLDIIACNLEAFAEVMEFRALLLASRTSASADGRCDLFHDLRERWLASGLDRKDESVAKFDERLEMLVRAAQQDANDDDQGGFSCVPANKSPTTRVMIDCNGSDSPIRSSFSFHDKSIIGNSIISYVLTKRY